MAKHFLKDVEVIHNRLMSLFGVVEQMIDKAVRALCEQKVELAIEVIETDHEVNQTEVEIEEECLKILALHQPVATDLRRITTVLKINSDLERIADLGCNIAERAQCMHEHPFFPIPEQLTDMVRQSTMMVRLALDAFVESNVDLAKKVIQLDASVDAYNLSVIEELQTLMRQDSDLVVPALHCFSASRHVERIADHAENIAEDVIYLVDGDIIRHRHDLLTKVQFPWRGQKH
ncbi:MAG: phosphate signaling complex protein PhoU [Planctomycetaceae bacterium]|nr:phosphate signaling complex protein PhoU [Planctomycetaceae bacterium]MCP4479089.1 phosphate signaling complex protein PhoU [Planctomycetaceae bacterium]MCP4773495.1 phosphate signaling complex protein PhoU [Planctomycetaceae bacterium]MDC0265914.1 phosphate signaling complex protein PhoU [Mariniblastus sp.]